MALVEIRNLTKVFARAESPFGGGAHGEVRAVDDVSLDIHSGETLGLVGESGSGKSTLGRLILRLIEPTSGAIRYEGRDLLATSGSEMRRLRRDLQIIFQDPFASLDPRFRVQDIIAEPLIIHGDANANRGGHDFSRTEAAPGSSVAVEFAERPAQRTSGAKALTERKGFIAALKALRHPKPSFSADGLAAVGKGVRPRVIELLRAVGLDESALRRYPHEFSGGQRQRIGIARALALRPKFIVCDEPVSALDVSVGAQIVNLLAELQREFGLTYLFISHAMPVVRYLSTRIAVMYRGKIVEVGETSQISERPQHAYTRSLLEATPEMG